MDVTDVVDHKSKSSGKTIILVSCYVLFHDLLVLVGAVKVFLMVEPVGKSAHGLGDVVAILLEVVVIDAATLVKEG